MADGAFLAAPEHLALKAIAAAYKPAPPVDLNSWAVANVRFGPESQFQGPYNPDRFPFFARVLEVLGPDHPAREVVLLKSAQIGGTVLAQIFLGGTMDLDPGPFLYVHPTIDNALRWMRQKWKPMLKKALEAGTALGRVFPLTTSRDGNNSLTYQERLDGRGFLQLSGANSEASLSMMSVPRQIQDDLSKWENNNAGDPEAQANSRSKAFEWAKLFKLGTPLIEDNCRITRNFKRSSQEHYYVPCPHCGHMQTLEWENLQANIEAQPESAPFFTCVSPGCGGVIEEMHRKEMLEKGEWRAHNPAALLVIGFYLWAAYSPAESWTRIRDDWLGAKGDPAREQTFLNDTVGRAFKAAGEAPPWQDLRDRAEANGHRKGLIPAGGLLLAGGADIQGDRVEWHVIAFGRDLKQWTVEYDVIEGHISEEATRKKLDELTKRTWPDSFGNRRPLDMLAVDGNAWTDDVFDWAKRHPASKVMVVRGAKSDLAPPLAKVKERNAEGNVKRRHRGRFFNVGVSQLKMALYQNLKKTDPLQRGYCGLPQGLEEDFFRQLCSERRAPQRLRTGYLEYRWVKDPNVRNEVLDTAIYATAAAIRLKWRAMTDEAWDALQAEREVPAETGTLDLEDLLLAGGKEKPAEGEAPAASAPRTKKLSNLLA
jgi:phage terminase large subunit GpA-like protein